jgi:hypothetical protein
MQKKEEQERLEKKTELESRTRTKRSKATVEKYKVDVDPSIRNFK